MRDGHINRRTQDKIRSSIDAQAIVKRLQDHCLGKIKMTATQVRAGEIVARKVLADLTAQTITAEATDIPLLQIVKPDAASQHDSAEDKPKESAA